MSKQISSQLLMVRPSAFTFNPETATSNKFQIADLSLSRDESQILALKEFNNAVDRMIDNDIVVGVIDDNIGLPDAVFPNNWLMTTFDKLILFPMESEFRRKERNPSIIDSLLLNYNVKEVLDLSGFESEGRFLEGTGSIVLDRISGLMYAAKSYRTDELVLNRLAQLLGFKPVVFNTRDKNGDPIYHTNVMMAIGNDIAVVCIDAIVEDVEVIESLRSSGKEIIPISMEQMENFCGNLLQVRNEKDVFWLMSERAYNSFTETQIEKITSSGKIISIKLDHIEKIGGGSIRCMVTEIFLQPQ